MEIEEIILEELREFRKETDNRLRSLEETRAEGRGMKSTIKLLMSTSLVSAIVSYITGHH